MQYKFPFPNKGVNPKKTKSWGKKREFSALLDEIKCHLQESVWLHHSRYKPCLKLTQPGPILFQRHRGLVLIFIIIVVVVFIVCVIVNDHQRRGRTSNAGVHGAGGDTLRDNRKVTQSERVTLSASNS